MEEKIVYNNYTKAAGKIVFGIGIIIAGIFGGSVIFMGAIFLGGSLIFFGVKSTSKKPQLIFSDKGLYIGFKANRWIKRENIQAIVVKSKKVDNRFMNFLEITMTFNINAPSNKLVKEFPIENLKIETLELQRLIKEFMNNKIVGVSNFS